MLFPHTVWEAWPALCSSDLGMRHLGIWENGGGDFSFPRGLKHGLKKKKKNTKSYHIAENLENREREKKKPTLLP